jgi:hypothetical protein
MGNNSLLSGLVTETICRGLMEPKRIPSGKQRRESRVINAGYRLVLFGV